MLGKRFRMRSMCFSFQCANACVYIWVFLNKCIKRILILVVVNILTLTPHSPFKLGHTRLN